MKHWKVGDKVRVRSDYKHPYGSMKIYEDAVINRTVLTIKHTDYKGLHPYVNCQGPGFWVMHPDDFEPVKKPCILIKLS